MKSKRVEFKKKYYLFVKVLVLRLVWIRMGLEGFDSKNGGGGGGVRNRLMSFPQGVGQMFMGEERKTDNHRIRGPIKNVPSQTFFLSRANSVGPSV
jgi:hypothetical protein